MGDTDTGIRVRGNLICFPVSHAYFFVGRGPKSIAKLDGGMGGFALPGSVTLTATEAKTCVLTATDGDRELHRQINRTKSMATHRIHSKLLTHSFSHSFTHSLTHVLTTPRFMHRQRHRSDQHPWHRISISSRCLIHGQSDDTVADALPFILTDVLSATGPALWSPSSWARWVLPRPAIGGRAAGRPGDGASVAGGRATGVPRIWRRPANKTDRTVRESCSLPSGMTDA